MALRTNARNPLAYMGVKASTPPQLVTRRFKPTSADYHGFKIGTFWVVPDIGTTESNKVWMLTDITANVASWIDITAAPSLTVPNPEHGVLLSDGAGGINNSGTGTVGQPLISQGSSADPAYGVISIAGGGTGLSSITAHSLLVGDGANPLNEIAISPTVGSALISQGSSADPIYSSVNVASGGLGSTAHTAYTPLCGGVTTTGDVQSLATIGTAGQILTSNGAGTLPTWQDAPSGSMVLPGPNDNSIITQYGIAGSGTHVLNANTSHVEMILISGGAGGAGGGNWSTGSDQSYAYSSSVYQEIPISYFGGGGASVPYEVGAGGAGGAAGLAGGVGAATSFGQYETAVAETETLAAVTLLNPSIYGSIEEIKSNGAYLLTVRSNFISPGKGGKGTASSTRDGANGTSFIRLYNPAMSDYSALTEGKSKIQRGFGAAFGTWGRNASPTNILAPSITIYAGGGGGSAGNSTVNGGNGSGPGGGGGTGFGDSTPSNRTAGGNGADGGIIIIEYLM